MTRTGEAGATRPERPERGAGATRPDGAAGVTRPDARVEVTGPDGGAGPHAGAGGARPDGGAGGARPAGVARAGPWWWERRRAMALDVALAVASALECAAEGGRFAAQHGGHPALGAVAGALVGAVLLLRRRWPVTVVLVDLAVTPARMGVVMGVVALYTLAATAAPRRIIAALGGLTAAGTLAVAYLQMNRDLVRHGTADWWTALVEAGLVAVGLTAPPVLLGLYVGARRRLVETLRERAEDLERELALLAEKAEERAERARSEERTRIAREMHDVVAHRVSLMVVHAAALRTVLRSDPDRADEGAVLLGDIGRQALGELRQMLGVLRTGSLTPDRPATPPSRGPLGPASLGGGPLPAAPLDGAGGGRPNLGELGVLVEQSRAAGMAVTLSEEGDRRPLAADVERAAYRVVQEALTNAHKHAAGAATLVRVSYRAEEVSVLVENGPAAGRPRTDLPGGGNGLVGMEERVRALGGGFAAGPSRSGGYRVSAVIPATRRPGDGGTPGGR